MSAHKEVYWIDSNVLISAKDGPYRFSINPGFWAALDKHANTGQIRVPKLVYSEIVRDGPNDELASWLKSRRANGFCVPPDKEVQLRYAAVAAHVQNKYAGHQAAAFLGVADPWVIAHALATSGSVVTFESSQPLSKKVKIPDVCHSMNVQFVDLYDMLEVLGITFKVK